MAALRLLVGLLCVAQRRRRVAVLSAGAVSSVTPALAVGSVDGRPTAESGTGALHYGNDFETFNKPAFRPGKLGPQPPCYIGFPWVPDGPVNWPAVGWTAPYNGRWQRR